MKYVCAYKRYVHTCEKKTCRLLSFPAQIPTVVNISLTIG